MIKKILDEFNKTNSTNDKKIVLEKHKDNLQLIEVFQKALDKVKWTYGITLKNIPEYKCSNKQDLQWALTSLELLADRTYSGHAALDYIHNILSSISEDNAYIIERILDRDLKIRFGKTEFNKIVDKGLQCTRPPYTRCEIGTKANILKNMPVDKDGNFKNKVYSEVKMDGTFRRAVVDGTDVEITSRPGIAGSFPLIEAQLKTIPFEGYVYIGEMTLRGEQDRSKGNGLINSDDIPHDDVLFTVWDMIPIQEYAMTKDEIKKAEKAGTLSHYEDRFNLLEHAIKNIPGGLANVELIEYRIVKNMTEAYEHFQEVTLRGDEGTVIKAHDMTHKDGNSKKQLKVKLVIELDMRITGFNAGNKGSKNEAYFSGINFENDEGTIKGSVGVTSLTEKDRDYFHENREFVIGQVMSMVCNDITQASGNDFKALSHPRYDKLRGKEKETDTLERALEQKQMAMELK